MATKKRAKTDKQTKIYRFQYKHENCTHEVLIPAGSKAEATAKFESLKASGAYYAESESPEWDGGRCDELEQLRAMVNDCQSLDSGNLVIERMQRLIKTSQELDGSNWRRERPSFLEFLKEIAIANRFAT